MEFRWNSDAAKRRKTGVNPESLSPAITALPPAPGPGFRNCPGGRTGIIIGKTGKRGQGRLFQSKSRRICLAACILPRGKEQMSIIFQMFTRDESGAATADRVMLAALVAGLAVALFVSLGGASADDATTISNGWTWRAIPTD
jgi:Flp pilus assembly pilin Flp